MTGAEKRSDTQPSRSSPAATTSTPTMSARDRYQVRRSEAFPTTATRGDARGEDRGDGGVGTGGEAGAAAEQHEHHGAGDERVEPDDGRHVDQPRGGHLLRNRDGDEGEAGEQVARQPRPAVAGAASVRPAGPSSSPPLPPRVLGTEMWARRTFPSPEVRHRATCRASSWSVTVWPSRPAPSWPGLLGRAFLAGAFLAGAFLAGAFLAAAFFGAAFLAGARFAARLLRRSLLRRCDRLGNRCDRYGSNHQSGRRRGPRSRRAVTASQGRQQAVEQEHPTVEDQTAGCATRRDPPAPRRR